MYFAVYPSKDTTITDVTIDGSSKTGSNSGRSEILELYTLTSSISNRGKSRLLLTFDLTGLSSSISSGLIPSSSVQYRLKLKNSQHYEKLPSSYTVEILKLSRSHDEGNGLAMFDEELKDGGYANWNNATSLVAWDSAGGDFVQEHKVTQSFDYGDEDLDVDISNIVGSWLTGSFTNYGLILKYLDAHETGSSDLYVKKFYSRHAHVPERRPRIEALWSNERQDDRNNVHYKISSSLYYYRMIDGIAQNAGVVYVQIINSSSTVVQTLTASNPEVGVYHASGVFVQQTSSTQIYRDLWFNSNEQLFTGTFAPNFSTGSTNLQYDLLDLSVTNLRPEYVAGQKITLNVLAREKDYKSAVRKSGSLDPAAIMLKDAYYSILNANTEEVIVNFSTGSLAYSKLSYDKNGNSFTLWTDSLTENSVYKVKILVNYSNQKMIFDKNWKFKIIKE